MAHIENPYNLDVEDDDALFAGALSQGLIWIDDDDDEHTDYYTDNVLGIAHEFIRERGEEWVNFSRLGQHLHKTFEGLDFKRLGENGKTYKSVQKFFADYSSEFDLRQDDQKPGLYWIRLKQMP